MPPIFSLRHIGIISPIAPSVLAILKGKTEKRAVSGNPPERWKGNPTRPLRDVTFLDLSRILPVGGRVGYAKIAKSRHVEAQADKFDNEKLGRLSNILGHTYEQAKIASADIDPNRPIPVLERTNTSYSGYHQGQGETTIAELIQADLPKYGLVLIDEIESSLHPSAQRRLIRDLATICREREVQIILTTHSPYVLEELPKEARIQIFSQSGERQAMIGVSPEFALNKMDEAFHPECEIYVEDVAAQILLREIVSQIQPGLVISTFYYDIWRRFSWIPAWDNGCWSALPTGGGRYFWMVIVRKGQDVTSFRVATLQNRWYLAIFPK